MNTLLFFPLSAKGGGGGGKREERPVVLFPLPKRFLLKEGEKKKRGEGKWEELAGQTFSYREEKRGGKKTRRNEMPTRVSNVRTKEKKEKKEGRRRKPDPLFPPPNMGGGGKKRGKEMGNPHPRLPKGKKEGEKGVVEEKFKKKRKLPPSNKQQKKKRGKGGGGGKNSV